MRARLTPRQIQMLSDGKCLSSGSMKYRVPSTETGMTIRKALKKCLEDGDIVYLDTENKEITYEHSQKLKE